MKYRLEYRYDSWKRNEWAILEYISHEKEGKWYSTTQDSKSYSLYKARMGIKQFKFAKYLKLKIIPIKNI